MIKIEKHEVLGFDHSIRGMRNAFESWSKSDSYWWSVADDLPRIYYVGDNDLTLMKKLSKAGTDHRKFMRMIVVYADITAPLYWWKQMDQYKVGTVSDSCSTMHKIHAKEFTLDDFSIDQMLPGTVEIMEHTIEALNHNRKLFIETKLKSYWWQMIQLRPSSYSQKRTVMMNYEVLANIYKSRKNHKLDEWREFCQWIEALPYSELITGKDYDDGCEIAKG